MAGARLRQALFAAAACLVACLGPAPASCAADNASQAAAAVAGNVPDAAASPADTLSTRAAPPESSLEVRVFRLLNRGAANPALDAVMPVVTDFRRSRIPLLFVWAALVIFGRRRGRLAALMLIPLIAASDQLSSSVIKPLVERMRPCEVLGEVRLWYGPEGWITTPAETAGGYKGSWSFPSGHATNITAAMLLLGLVYRRLLPALLAVAVLVSWSRIYIGVHWPLDALAGMALGAGLAWPAWLVMGRIGRRVSDDKHGADGLLDDAGGGAAEKKPARPV